MIEEITVERPQPLEQKLPYPSSSNSTDCLSFQIISSVGNGCNLPLPINNLLIPRNKVPHKNEDPHELVFRNRNSIASGDLSNRQSSRRGCLEVNVIGANSGCQKKLQILGLFNPLRGDISRVERGCDQNMHILNVFLKLCINNITKNQLKPSSSAIGNHNSF